MMKLKQLSHNEDIEIQCNAISAPNESEPVVIQWMRNGRKINKGNHNILFNVYTYFYCKTNLNCIVSGFFNKPHKTLYIVSQIAMKTSIL